jgi:hypothetical protein
MVSIDCEAHGVDSCRAVPRIREHPRGEPIQISDGAEVEAEVPNPGLE